MPKQTVEQSLKGSSSKQPAKKRKVSDDELSELTSSPAPSDRESPSPSGRGSVKARDSNKRPVKKRRVVSDDEYDEYGDLTPPPEEKSDVKMTKRDTKIKTKATTTATTSTVGKLTRQEGQRIAKVDDAIPVREEQDKTRKINPDVQPETADVPQKKKLPTIKKKTKQPGVLTSAAASATPSAVPSPSARPPAVPGSGTNKEATPLTTLNPSGSGDFDLRDSNTWQSLLGKKNANSGPRVGIEKRQVITPAVPLVYLTSFYSVSTQERRKQLDKMREEARASRNEQLKTTFDLQAQSQKIMRYEKTLSRQQIQASHILGIAFKDRPIIS